MAYADVPSSADGGDRDAGEAAEVLQRVEQGSFGQADSACSRVADYSDKGHVGAICNRMLFHVSALSHWDLRPIGSRSSGEMATRSESCGLRMEPLGPDTTWLEVLQFPEAFVWGKRLHVEDVDEQRPRRGGTSRAPIGVPAQERVKTRRFLT